MRAAIALGVLATACQVTGTYRCMSDGQCARGSNAGFCETTGYCSFSDPSCDSQRRYDTSAGSGLESTCVDTIVTGYYRQRFATNDVSFMPTVVEIPPPATAVLTVTLDDGTQPKVHVAPDGHFAFDVARVGQAYRLVVDGVEYQLAAPHLDLALIGAGRPARVPVTLPTSVTVTTSGSVGGNDGIATTGLWTVLDVSTNNSQFSFDWKTATSLSGTLGLLDANQHDQLFVTKRTTANSVQSLVGFGIASVTLADGMTAMVSNVAITRTTDECRQLTAPLLDHEMRLAMAVPGGMPAWTWEIEAAAVPDQIGLAAAQTVAWSGFLTAPTNIDMPETIGNPFPGTTLVASTAVGLSYPFAMMGFPGPNLSAGLSKTSTFAAGATCADQKPSLDASLAIAGELSVDGTAVTADDQSITVDATKPAQLAWKLAVPGEVGAFRVTLFEVTNNGTNASLTKLHQYVTVAPQLALPAGLLASGHTYILSITSEHAPMAAAGNFVTFVLPLETALTYSHSFAVQ